MSDKFQEMAFITESDSIMSVRLVLAQSGTKELALSKEKQHSASYYLHIVQLLFLSLKLTF